MKLIIDGNSVSSAKDIHKIFQDECDFGPYYGKNLHALWDMLTTEVERPFVVHWVNISESKRCLGEQYEQFIKLFEDLERYDLDLGLREPFQFIKES